MAFRLHRPSVFLHRPRFFSTYEWWYHLLMMPVLFPVGNYFFIGPRYFREPLLFGVGTGLVFGLYWLSVITLTLTVRAIIRRYPAAGQTTPRMLVMLVAVGALTIGLAVFDVWVYSLVPATGVQFSWTALQPILLLGLLFDVFLCMTLGLVYTYSQWNNDLQEDEQLQREGIQRQYDTLKGQLNPHFLFNALNSLSVLIHEEPKRAEEFVDKLALVYRYMLQPGQKISAAPGELVTLQAEMSFINAYVDLLQIRYGQSLQIKLPVLTGNPYATYSLPPLSVQTLVDNAINYNGMSARNPLLITIEITPDGWLQVTNNRHPKTIRLDVANTGLGDLTAKYRLLSDKRITVDDTDAYFRVALPLVFTQAPQSLITPDNP